MPVVTQKFIITISFYPGNDLSEADKFGITIPGEK